MTVPLSHEEHLELLGCIRELHACRSLAAFPEHALRALDPLIPNNLSAFNEVNVPRGRIFFITNHPSSPSAKRKSSPGSPKENPIPRSRPFWESPPVP